MPESEGHKILGQVEVSTVAHSIKNAVKRSEYAIYFKEKMLQVAKGQANTCVN